MKNCTQTKEALPALLYGDLRAEEAAAVRRHLDGCPACRAECAGLRQVQALLDTAPAPAVEVDLPRLYRDAARRQEKRLRRWRRLAVAGLAAAAVLLLAFCLRLEVRLQAHQLVVRWGAPPEVPAPRPEPQAPRGAPPAPGVTPADLQPLRDLVHILAGDVAERDGEQKRALLALQQRLDVLQGQAQERWVAAQRDVGGLYALFNAQFGPRDKGE